MHTPTALDKLDADILIVGAGPVGLTLANLLGMYGVRTLVIERNAQLEGEPRAVTLDDESLRTLQNAGLVDDVLTDVVLGYGVQYFDWRGQPLAAIRPTRQEYGYPKRNAFRQPLLVRTLAQGLRRFPHVGLRFGHTLHAFTQEEGLVRCEAATADGPRTLTARWLIACDGGRSPVRELCRIVLDGDTYPERWLIVDMADRLVPLRHTQTYCDPRRPAIRLPGPHGTLRYEFMLRPGDRDDDVLAEATFRGWIRDRVPEDADLRLVRKAIYGFHARVATQWRQGRVLLAGDAAHLTPPFAGQGLNSGMRDAANLGWKLAAVVAGQAAENLLDSYEQERRPHAAALIQMALRIGTFMQPKTRLGAALTQTALRLACLVPACRDYILQLRFKPRPELSAGFFERSGRLQRSELLPQPQVQLSDGSVQPLDVLLGTGFAILGRDTSDFRSGAPILLPSKLQARAIAVVPRDHDFLASVAPGDITRVRDMTGELDAILDRYDAAALLVRPDRYCFAVLDAEQLRHASSTGSRPASAIEPHATLNTLWSMC